MNHPWFYIPIAATLITCSAYAEYIRCYHNAIKKADAGNPSGAKQTWPRLYDSAVFLGATREGSKTAQAAGALSALGLFIGQSTNSMPDIRDILFAVLVLSVLSSIIGAHFNGSVDVMLKSDGKIIEINSVWFLSEKAFLNLLMGMVNIWFLITIVFLWFTIKDIVSI